MTLAESLIERGLELARGEALAELELANTTPALVGGWRGHSLTNPRRCLVEPARPTDIAGKMRWWLRSILAAGYYEIHGVHPPLYLADRLAATIMGDTREASKITLRLKPLDAHCRWGELPVGKPADIRQVLLERARSSGGLIERLAKLCNDSLDVNACFAAALLSPRVLLQLLGAQDDPRRAAGLIPLPPGCYRFRLTVHERPHARWSSEGLREAALRAAGTALGMTLFFTGIGRMVTRGYGKLAPLNHIDEGSPLAQSLAETWSQLTAHHGPLHVAHRAVREAVDYLQQLEACNGCRRPVVRPHELEAALHRDEATTSLPLNPTLHPDYITVRSTSRVALTIPNSCCTKVYCNDNPWCVVAALSQAATAKAFKCALQDKPCYTPMHLLGLPRGSRGSGWGDGRGYVCMYIGGDKDRASDRMLSLIQMTPVYRPSMNDFKCNAMYVVHVLGFKTMFLNLSSEGYPKYYRCKILHYNRCYDMDISIFDEVDQQLINGMRNLSIYDNNTKSINIDRFIDSILEVIS